MNDKNVFDDREISWLKFNERVLDEAVDMQNPLLERLKFISIFARNLDEFFMVRMGSLYDRLKIEGQTDDIENEIDKLLASVGRLVDKKDNIYADTMTELQRYNIRQINEHDQTQEEHDFLKAYFYREIAPVISPTVVNRKLPFPFIANRQMAIVVDLLSKKGKSRLGIIPVASTLPRMIFVPDGAAMNFILTENLICIFANRLFDKYEIRDRGVIRCTRNADIDESEALLDHEIDYRDEMEDLLAKRVKLSLVRLEYIGHDGSTAINTARKLLKLNKRQVYRQKSSLDFSYIADLTDKLPVKIKAELSYKPLIPVKNKIIDAGLPMIDQIRQRDILIAYPFEDIADFLRLLHEAASDKRVKTIMITLYRVAAHSKIVHELIEAARNGKEVLCAVEIRASFDEGSNIDWSKKLEDNDCNVIYGLPDFKLHAKLLQITYDDKGKERFITQIGTGNYNEVTSHIYTDISLLTADGDIARDAQNFFKKLSEGKFVDDATQFLVAPLCLKPRLEDLIDRQIQNARQNNDGYIFLKLNALTDRDLMNKLIEASQAGVKIDLIIRGICCLIGGVEGLTGNITVKSIVGRFLEHSRICMFGKGEQSQLYLSSADFMTRSTTHRVEIAAPVKDAAAHRKLLQIIETILKDNVNATEQDSDGKYQPIKITEGMKPVNSQIELFGEL